MDANLELIVWNIESYQVVQSIFLCQKELMQMSPHCSLHFEDKSKSVFVLSKHFFELRLIEKKVENMELQAISSSDDNQEIIVTTNKEVKFFSSLNGDLKRTYCTLFQDLRRTVKMFRYNTSSKLLFILDDNETLMILKEINVLPLVSRINCQFKNFFPIEHTNLFIVHSKEDKVELYQYDYEEIQLIKTLKREKYIGDFICFGSSKLKQMIVGGFSNGYLTVWGLQFGSNYHSLVKVGKNQIEKISFLDRNNQYLGVIDSDFRV